MKELSKAIFAKLAGSALDTAIGGRFYKARAPEGTAYPYVIFMLVSDVPADTFKDKLDDVLIQFSLFSSASSSTEIEDIYANLETLYDDCSLTITGSTAIWMKRQNATLMMEDHITSNGTVEVWHYAVDYSIIAQRT